MPLSVHSAIPGATCRKHLQTHLFDLAFPPRTLVRQADATSSFIIFAIEHWFGCRATEPALAENVGAMEIWLMDWLIDTLQQYTRQFDHLNNSSSYQIKISYLVDWRE